MRTFSATPKASMLSESMRDIGYSLETALADIIDNSITAQARNIQLFANIDDSDVRIGILDDGEGMTENDLLEAMRPGCRSPLDTRGISDLGRFGLGLKTASFSQCRRLTVVTRRDGDTSAAIWDLDYVAEQDDWLVQIPDDSGELPWVHLLGGNGTLVIWEKMDRLLSEADSVEARPDILRRIDEARKHLELVFHRFLSGEHGMKKVRMSLNNRPLEPYDPFHADHPATLHHQKEKIKVGDQEVVVQAFTLPHHSKVSQAVWQRHEGRDGYLKSQGFYVYREKRLIIHGTWLGLARQMELTKLTRVRIDIKNGMDSDWKIDVKKSSAQLPYQVRARLRRIIEQIGAGSKRIYRKRGQILTPDNRLPVWNRVQDQGEIVYRVNLKHPVFEDFVSRLPDAMKSDFGRVLELVGSTLPVDALFADMGSSPEQVSGNTTSDETLRHTIDTTYKRLREARTERDEISEMLKLAEPFRSNWNRTEEMLAQISAEEARDV